MTITIPEWFIDAAIRFSLIFCVVFTVVTLLLILAALVRSRNMPWR